MSALCWNCQGLGIPCTVRDLCLMIKVKRPNFVFLMETKQRREYLQKIKRKMGFEGCFTVEPVGKSGGLALLWKEVKEVEILNYSQRHISAKISGDGPELPWFFTGFYGHPERHKREASWQILHHLSSLFPHNWLCTGDFNDITEPSEKVGGTTRSNGHMDKFCDMIHQCNLGDLGYRGSKFTWSNKRDSEEFIKARLDRAMATPDWTSRFIDVFVEVLVTCSSDHKPLWISFASNLCKRRGQRPFKFEACWNLDEESLKIVKDVWEGTVDAGGAMEETTKKLILCEKALKGWSSSKYGNISRTIQALSKQLKNLQINETPTNAKEIQALQQKIDGLMEMEDVRWKQRAKRHWYKSGDRNTQFFHAWANQRRRQNSIGNITDLEGRRWSDHEGLGRAFSDYYQQLFSTEGVVGLDECLSTVSPKVSPDMNELLLKPFLPEEIDHALAQMSPLKAPGPDGFGVSFFQKHWQTVGDLVRTAALDFLNNGILPPSVNTTFIALIPKHPLASSVTDFRPISLCNVLYKIMAKVLVNRFKQVLPSVISSHQSAFVPGRLISDNILVAYEALHTMHTRMQGKQGYMAIKLDISKVYDRVEWDYLEAIMYKLGFAGPWINRIMQCVKSVSYSVLINGTPYGRITPTRGIKQGDPLSPYLFLLCAEGLSSLIGKAEEEGLISGVPIVARGYKLSHLLFADDSLLFCRANSMEWDNVMNLLMKYEKVSGTKAQ